MKILHVYNHFHPCTGGVENQIENLCVGLRKLGHHSDVCCLDTCVHSKEKLPPKGEHKGIRIIRMPYLDFKYYKIAPSVIKMAKQYDVLHLHGLGFFMDFLGKTKWFHGKPIIFSTHGGIFHTKRIMPLKNLYFNAWARFILKKADKIIAVSRNDQKLFSKISENVEFIPNGIDFDRFSIIKRKPEKNTLLFIGRLSPNKRIDRLIETVHYLRKKKTKMKLYIAGRDWKGEERRLRQMVRRDGLSENVIFLGEVNEKEKMDCLKKAEFFVSSSEYEGFGVSIIEAMASGVPVVVSDIESFRNLIDKGKNGFIVDYTDSEKAAGLISGITDKTKKIISKNAKERASLYDTSKLIRKMVRIYRDSTQRH